MKVRKSLTVLALGLSVFITSAVSMAKGKIDHAALSQKYEKMASEQDAIIKEHEQMKKDKKSMQAGLPKATREKTISDMEKHCDAIISDAKKLGEDYRAMAQWHKMRDEEEKSEK